MGFAHYMDHIGANEAVVRGNPAITDITFPYVLLFLLSFRQSSSTGYPSATGLAVLLMGTMFPIMLGLGLSAASAAGVIATSLGVAYTPTAIDAIRGSGSGKYGCGGVCCLSSGACCSGDCSDCRYQPLFLAETL